MCSVTVINTCMTHNAHLCTQPCLPHPPRFCDYQIKRSGGAAPDAAGLLAMGGEGDGEGGARGLLQSKLAALQVRTYQQSCFKQLGWCLSVVVTDLS